MPKTSDQERLQCLLDNQQLQVRWTISRKRMLKAFFLLGLVVTFIAAFIFSKTVDDAWASWQREPAMPYFVFGYPVTMMLAAIFIWRATPRSCTIATGRITCNSDTLTSNEITYLTFDPESQRLVIGNSAKKMRLGHNLTGAEATFLTACIIQGMLGHWDKLDEVTVTPR